MTTAMTGQRVRVGDVELYAEVRGTGPAIVLVPGGGGDAGQFAALGAELATTRTVVTYDRRGNSRSARGPAWPQTSVEEQADDVVGLLDALDIASATVLGTSQGAQIALATALRAPHRVDAVLVHDAALMTVLADPDAALAAVQPVIGAGMAAGGPAGGAEAFFRFADDVGFSELDEQTRARMLGNAQTLFEGEFGAFSSWRPDEAALSAGTVPVSVLVAERALPMFQEAAAWLAARTGTRVGTAPGGHLGFADRASEFAAALVLALGGTGPYARSSSSTASTRR